MRVFVRGTRMLLLMVIVFAMLGTSTISASSGAVKKENIANPKQYPGLKEYFVPLEQQYDKTDNGVQVYYKRIDLGFAITGQLIAKKNGKTLWKKDYHQGYGILAVEGNLIFLKESNRNSSISGPHKLLVLNTQGKTVYSTDLNGSINMNGYQYVRSGDILYFVTDRPFERQQFGGSDPSKQYSRVVAVSVKTGKILWSKGVGMVGSPPVLYKGKIYVTDQFNGLWSFDSKGTKNLVINDPTLEGRPYFSPNGYVYLTTGDPVTYKEQLVVYDPAFQLLWKQPYDGFFLSIAFDKDLIFLSTNQYVDDAKTKLGYEFSGRMYAFNDKGKLLWSQKHAGYNTSGTVVSGDHLFFISYLMNPAKEFFGKNYIVVFKNRLYGLNKRTGEVVYKTGVGDYYFPTYQFEIPGKTQKPNLPIVEETSSTNKKTYYLLK
ncbi:outer membrane protein assembly factor BamB family protein [Pseudoneobacillus sp. C159]